MISKSDFDHILFALRVHPEPLNGIPVDEHIDWSENVEPPDTPEEFALEAIFVICNSGMNHKVARGIYERVRVEMLEGGRNAHRVFGHEGKAQAINDIWDRRAALHAGYLNAQDKIEFCGSLPWIGEKTKYHLAKNFGADVAKPDVHLQRLADRHGTTVQALCDELAQSTGLKSRTVDLVLWMACAKGVIDSTTGRIGSV